MKLVNPFKEKGKWYKANFHTHTTNSDGTFSLDEIVKRYRDAGYSALVITDHDKACDVSKYCTKDFLVISGIEAEASSNRANVYHIVGINVPPDMTLERYLPANDVIAMIKEAGGEAILAHPYWTGLVTGQLLDLRGHIGIEVYNTATRHRGRAFSMVHWDEILSEGIAMPAPAVDDTHGEADMFRGWTMLKMKSLSLENVMEALRTGCYYSSCGPEFKDFHLSGEHAVIKCSPVREAHRISAVTWRTYGLAFYADDGPDMTSAKIWFNKDSVYCRGQIIDAKGRCAWTNPIIL